MKLVGLAGKARSGKDTIAHMWANERRTKRYALADPVRAAASAMFNLPLDTFTGDNPDREKVNDFWGISPRRMLQLVGTECGREVFRADIWTKNAEIQLNMTRGMNHYDPIPVEYFMVTDIRFEDEAAWIRQQGGIVIHVLRDTPPLDNSVEQHKSEEGIEIVDGDLALYNSGTIDQLRNNVSNLLLRMEAVI